MAKMVLWIITICGFITLYTNYHNGVDSGLTFTIVLLSLLSVLAVVEAIEQKKS